MATHSATGADTRRTPGALGRATRRLATETKQAFKTTEFWAMVALVIAILIAGNAIEAEKGGPDLFSADKVWLYHHPRLGLHDQPRSREVGQPGAVLARRHEPGAARPL